MNKVKEVVRFSKDRNRPEPETASDDHSKRIVDYIEQNPGTSAVAIIHALPPLNGKTVYSVLYRFQRQAKLKSRKLDGLVRWYPNSYLFPEEIHARKEVAVHGTSEEVPLSFKHHVVLNYVKSKQMFGTSQTDMAKKLGYASTSAVTGYVRDLLALGMVEQRGQGRASRLFPTAKALADPIPTPAPYKKPISRRKGANVLLQEERVAREQEVLSYIAANEGKTFSVGDIYKNGTHLKALSYSTTFQLVRKLELDGKIVRRDFRYYLASESTLVLAPLRLLSDKRHDVREEVTTAAPNTPTNSPYIAITIKGVIQEYLYQQTKKGENPNYLPDFINYVEENYHGQK